MLGTERHESRRIDNQLRGRSGRQGDPGRSRFYLSLEDDLMRIFGSERMDKMLQTLGLKEDEAIVHPWINKALEKAQQKVEARNFDIRKNLLKFDNVMNDQRKVIFEQRIGIMRGEDVSETIDDMRHQVIDDLVARHIPRECLCRAVGRGGLAASACASRRHRFSGRRMGEGGRHRRRGNPRARHSGRRQALCRASASSSRPRSCTQVEKAVLLQTLDHLWREHIVTVEHLRQVIHLRGYGQRDPLNEYKTEGFDLFEAMIARSARDDDLAGDARRDPAGPPPDDMLPDEDDLPPMMAHHIDAATGEDDAAPMPLFGASAQRGAAAEPRPRTIRAPGARSAATIPALAARARNTSTATAPMRDCRGARADLAHDQGSSAAGLPRQAVKKRSSPFGLTINGGCMAWLVRKAQSALPRKKAR